MNEATLLGAHGTKPTPRGFYIEDAGGVRWELDSEGNLAPAGNGSAAVDEGRPADKAPADAEAPGSGMEGVDREAA